MYVHSQGEREEGRGRRQWEPRAKVPNRSLSGRGRSLLTSQHSSKMEIQGHPATCRAGGGAGGAGEHRASDVGLGH